MRLAGALALVLLLGLVLPACETGGPFAGPADTMKKLWGDWKLTELMDEHAASFLPEGVELPTITFAEDGSVSGFSGVNRFMSQLDLDQLLKGDFSLGPVAGTRMAGPPEAMDLEQTFLQALEKVRSFKIDDLGLTLSQGDETLLRFAPAGE